MSDSGDKFINDPAHIQRTRFERVSSYGIAGVVFGYAIIGLVSNDMADRIVKLAPALATLCGTLAMVCGFSWARGHMDKRIDQ